MFKVKSVSPSSKMLMTQVPVGEYFIYDMDECRADPTVCYKIEPLKFVQLNPRWGQVVHTLLDYDKSEAIIVDLDVDVTMRKSR